MTLAIVNVNHGWSIGAAIAAALAVGLLVGIVNGGIVVLLGIDSLIATLGTSTFVSGVILWVSDSQTISGVSDQLIDYVVVKQILGIPLAFYYGIALGVIMFYVFEFTPLGRRLLFVGRGRNVASRRPGLTLHDDRCQQMKMTQTSRDTESNWVVRRERADDHACLRQHSLNFVQTEPTSGRCSNSA